ncbi:transporter substrate-binding domain-containing protein [Megasphaera paucivorans]|uniref:Putative glutamine transport system substrate-binding protein n=1 Tax=Megasphaera paucivorans TaxID=349095 RepID=A0A1G9TND4_9FIRM|nr:transporter substrate-binding domain-containing protein [Megasphaera paucivorans]SDM49210.1 putative glutamine transport system substrate-binding protein [Megasphaera paucivorans]
MSTWNKGFAMGAIGLTLFGLLAAGCGDANSSDASKKEDAGKKQIAGVQRIKERGVVKVGIGDTIKGFGYKESDGTITGIDADVAKAIAKDILGDENKIEFTTVTAKARGPVLDSDQVDFVIATYTVNEERKKSWDFSDIYYRDPVGFLVKKDSGITSAKELDGKTIAVQQGTTSRQGCEEWAKKYGIKLKYTEFPTDPEALSAMTSGRAAAYSTDSSILNSHMEGKPDLMLLPEKFAPQDYGIAVRKDNNELLTEINKVIKQLKESGELEKMIQKHHLVDFHDDATE